MKLFDWLQVGLPVGIIPDVAYCTDTIALEPGDVLAIYSDGITESLNEEGEEFGESRVIGILRQNPDCSAARLRERIEDAVAGFAGHAASVDDKALVIIKRSVSPGSARILRARAWDRSLPVRPLP